MSLGLNKIILANATTNTAGAYFSNTTVVAANAAPGTVIPAGTYIVFPNANAVITANNGSSITTVYSTSTGGMILSDGVNVFAQSAQAGNTTVSLLTVNGGVNVSGTYNS